MAISFNDNLDLRAPKLVDNRSAVFENGKVRPYNSLEEAYEKIPSQLRAAGLGVYIKNAEGKAQQYWFQYEGEPNVDEVLRLFPVANVTSDSFEVLGGKISKADWDLNQVDNTRDSDKPVSVLQREAIEEVRIPDLERVKLTELNTQAELDEKLSLKVNTEQNKSLVSNVQITKLEGLKTQSEIDLQIGLALSGKKGKVSISSPAPTEDGLYDAPEAGTYPNLGNLVVKTGYTTVLQRLGGVWSIYSEVSAIGTTGVVKKDEIKFVNGGQVYNTYDPFIKLKGLIDFILVSGSVSKTTGAFGASTSWLRTDYIIGIDPSKLYTIEGYGNNTDTLNNGRVFCYTSDNTFIGVVAGGYGGSYFTFQPLPLTEKIVIQIEGKAGVGTDVPNSPFWATFKIYQGEYGTIGYIVGENIEGRINTNQLLTIESKLDNLPPSAISGYGYPLNRMGKAGDSYTDLALGRTYIKTDSGWGKGSSVFGRDIPFTYPNDFTWRPVDIFIQGNGYHVSSVPDVYQAFVKSKDDSLTKYYVDPVNGNNLNSGLSRATALKSIKEAIAKGARNIKLLKGFYGRSESFDTVTDSNSTEPLLIMAEEDGVYLSSADHGTLFTWTPDENVFKTTRSGTRDVLDTRYKDDKIGFKSYLKVATLTECKATSGSWYMEGNDVYVNTVNGLAPTYEVKLNLEIVNLRYTVSANVPFVYFEGFDVYGMSTSDGALYIYNSITTQFDTKVYINQVKGIRNYIGGSIGINNFKEVWVQNCGGYYCLRDALNYHASRKSFGYESMKIVEISGSSYNTGYQSLTETSSNGSTTHEGSTSIRFGGKFDTARGSVVVDVNNGTRSLIFDAEASNSLLINTAGFHVQDGVMWLYNCYSHNNVGFSARADGTGEGGTIYYDSKTILDGATFGNVIPL